MTALENIIEQLKTEKLDGYFLPRNNMFLGEDIHPAENKILKLTGFSGSAGTLLIKTQGRSVLFVDSRYALQAPLETDSQIIEVVCTAEISMTKWMQQNLPPKFRLGFNPDCLSIKAFDSFQKRTHYKKNYSFIDFKRNTERFMVSCVFHFKFTFLR